jgi:hypothetical protein
MAYKFATHDYATHANFNQLLAISDSGVIAGYYGMGGSADPNKGYLLTPGYGQANYISENVPTSAQTQVTGINAVNATVGFWADANGDNVGFIDKGGVISSVFDPIAPTINGVYSEQFLGINDSGQVAGFYVNDTNGDTSGFVYNSNTGAFNAVTMAGATSLTATDINDKDQISGFFTKAGVTDGFVETNGKFLILSGPAGATDVQALGLNNAGLVVGSYMDTAGNTDGFVYNTATKAYTTVIDPAGNGTQTVVNGVNDAGTLVGFYMDAHGNTDGMVVSDAASPPTWTFQTLDDPASSTFNQLLSINNGGEITGYYGEAVNHGYTVDAPTGPAGFVNENYPGSAQTQVTGINNAGVTVGFFVDAAGNSQGFVDNNGAFSTGIDPHDPKVGGHVNEQILGVSDNGQAAGFYQTDAAGDTAGFAYNINGGQFYSVNIAGATSVTATDANDHGTITGFYTKNGTSAGFLDENGKIVTLAGPANASNVQVLGINNVGLAVGSYQDSGNNTHGFVFNTATNAYTTIDAPNAVHETVINGINDLDQIVGFYTDQAGNTHGLLGTLAALGSADLIPGGYLGSPPPAPQAASLLSGLGGSSALMLTQHNDTSFANIHTASH